MINAILGGAFVGLIWAGNEIRWYFKIHQDFGEYEDPDASVVTAPTYRHRKD